ncbi:hypothetical protein EDD86DRAFT_218143 [Gorgonomyces haynaldii]|nr:hypothetical protein EDD86DRAFT_218143 [Gorgonomyces haynaldii]
MPPSPILNQKLDANTNSLPNYQLQKEPELGGWYGPPNGLDVMNALVKLKTRANPVIELGPVDLTCAFLITDMNLNDHPIVYASATFQQLTGYGWDEVIGRNCRFLQDPHGKMEKGQKRLRDQEVIYAMRRCVETRSEGQFLCTNYKKDGTVPRLIVGLSKFSHTDSDLNGQPRESMEINLIADPMCNPSSYHTRFRQVYDLTAEESPDVSESMLGTAQEYLDTSSNLVHIVSLRGAILYVSPQACKRYLECVPEELVGKSLADIMHPDDYAFVMRQFRAANDRHVISYKCRMKKKSAGYRYIDVSGQKRTRCFILAGRETDLSNFTIPSDAVSSPDRNDEIWMRMSPQGLILFATSTFINVFAVDPIGHSVFELFHPDERVSLASAVDAIVAQYPVVSTSDPIPCVFNNRGTPLHAFVQFIGSTDAIGNTLYGYIRFLDQNYLQNMPDTLEMTPVFSNSDLATAHSLSYEINHLKFENKALGEAIKQRLEEQ